MSMPIIELVAVSESDMPAAMDKMNAALLNLYAGNAALVPVCRGVLALTSDAPRNPEIDARVLNNCMHEMRRAYPPVERLHAKAHFLYEGNPDEYLDRLSTK